MGVEPTTLAAKDRINGFEGREGHRTLFASVGLEGASAAAIIRRNGRRTWRGSRSDGAGMNDPDCRIDSRGRYRKDDGFAGDWPVRSR